MVLAALQPGCHVQAIPIAATRRVASSGASAAVTCEVEGPPGAGYRSPGTSAGSMTSRSR